MAIAAAELDPTFVKALRLLFSKSRDATDQLKQMLDDVLNQRQPSESKEIQKESDSKTLSGKISLFKPETLSQGKQNDVKKKEADKRPHDKIKTEADPPPETIKKPKYETQKSTGGDSTFALSIKEETETENDDQVTDADDFAMEMGLACIVCRSLDVQPGNQLVECQECHNLYHQECHRPPATDQDVNDPRLVWYCTRCTKTFKKLASKTQKSKTSVSSSTKESSQTKSTKPETPILQPFKRAEPKSTVLSSSSSSSSSTQPLTGLASLAANLSGKVISLGSKSSSGIKSSHKSGSSSSSGPSSGKSSLQLNVSSSMSFSKSQSSGVSVQKFGGLLSSLSNTTVSGKSTSGNSSSSNSNNGSSGNSNSSSSNSSSNSSNNSSNNSKANILSSNSSSSKQNNNNSNSSSSLMSADKRLQMMKKKAAAKMQEKRRLSK